MKKRLCRVLVLAVLALAPTLAKAAGWPANYEGVMLQAFYWDSYTDTKWTNLESQADELSANFSLIWVPNSAKAEGSPTMGYHPVYWFTNHNSSFGTSSQLRSMISTLKDKGVGVIADVIINHRSGTSNWTNFPAETWQGKTYRIGPEGICRDDEVAAQSGQATPTGNYDTGEHWDGSRDLDHTNANVQENCKAYIKCLTTDYGYAGVRYDFTKGYGAQYTKMYNQANNIEFSVGEYWDGSYDALASWIEGTGKTSAAFDFAFKYALNEAFSANDMSKLVWKANGTTNQPAGLIHFAYPQYAVTFIDNHDTYRDSNKFTGNVLAANAFMLSCPGTPCVFLPHWKANKTAISAMIQARKLAGVHNLSSVRVLKATRDCYMAEVTGKKGTLAVKIGSASDTPSGYTSSDIKASGNGYCMWVKTTGGGGGGNDDPIVNPGNDFNVYWDNTAAKWTAPHIHYWGDTSSKWPGVAMSKAEGNVWVYKVPAGTTGILFNAGDGDATKTSDFKAVANHVYTKSGDQGEYNGGGNDDPIVNPGNDFIYLIGEPAGGWKTNVGEKIFGSNGVYIYSGQITGGEYAYFGFAVALSSGPSDWTAFNSQRYGSPVNSQLPKPDANGNTVADYYTIDGPGNYAMGFPNSTSWRIAPGSYTFTVDTNSNTLKVQIGISGIEDVDVEASEPEYYNLQGVRVENPSKGLYIRVQGNKATKLYIR